MSYKGSSYYGWQDLGENQEKQTVQATIHHALQKICKYQSCNISVASRTDAGVHAQGQVIKISIPLEIASEKLLLGMNSLLPDDIRILRCEHSQAAFNPNKDAKSKEYHYYFCTDGVYNPLTNDITAHIPSSNTNPLNIKLMQEACKLFIGEHDFYSFAKRDASMDSTIRTIISCEIVRVEHSLFANELYCLKIVGEGFLRYMVRYIAGSLFSLGREQLSLTDINEALKNHKEKKISSRAKSRGLHLIRVAY
nr:tRNA pseudouridine(38-40) synthase TruA [Sulfurimonas aquatica]